jgi:hypothetical protein
MWLNGHLRGQCPLCRAVFYGVPTIRNIELLGVIADRRDADRRMIHTNTAAAATAGAVASAVIAVVVMASTIKDAVVRNVKAETEAGTDPDTDKHENENVPRCRRRPVPPSWEDTITAVQRAGGLFVGGNHTSVWKTTIVPVLYGSFSGCRQMLSSQYDNQRNADILTDRFRLIDRSNGTGRCRSSLN